MEVCILGGGIGGLTLAQTLRYRLGKRALVRVFERDASATSRQQGYGLSLRGNMGVTVLQKIGLGEAAEKIYTGVSTFFINTAAGRELMRLEGTNQNSPYFTVRVKRADLHNVLRSGLESEIVYDRQAVSFENQPDGKVQVNFANGTTTTADVVIACDGSRSLMRQQMLGVETEALDVTLINGRVPYTDDMLTKHLNPTSTLFAIGNGESVFCSCDGETREFIWSHGCHKKPGEVSSPAAALDLAKQATETWKQEPIAAMIAATDVSSISIRELNDKKVPATARRGNVVLLGDAAHSMTPYMGLGANTAMMDALDLGNGLADVVEGKVTLDAALQAYDVQMVARAAGHVASSRKACLSYHRASRLWTPIRNGSFWLGGCLLALLPKR